MNNCPVFGPFISFLIYCELSEPVSVAGHCTRSFFSARRLNTWILSYSGLEWSSSFVCIFSVSPEDALSYLWSHDQSDVLAPWNVWNVLCALFPFFCRIWSSYLELSGNFVPSITATTADLFSLNFPTYYFEIVIFISTLFLIDFLYKLLLLFLLLSLFLWIYSFPNCLISGLQTVVPECAQTHMNFSGMGEKSFLELLTAESVEMLWMWSSGLIKPVQLIKTAHSSVSIYMSLICLSKNTLFRLCSIRWCPYSCILHYAHACICIS